jgi:hypothetical protein
MPAKVPVREWLTALQLPALFISVRAVAEHQTLVEAITRELAMPHANCPHIWVVSRQIGIAISMRR